MLHQDQITQMVNLLTKEAGPGVISIAVTGQKMQRGKMDVLTVESTLAM
jgi:hypothetical protein